MVSAIRGVTGNNPNMTAEIALIRLLAKMWFSVLMGVSHESSGILGAMISVTTKPVIGTEETATKNTVPMKKLKRRKRRK